MYNDTELFNLINTVSGLNNIQLFLVGNFNFPDVDWNNWSSNHGSLNSNDFTEVFRDNHVITACKHTYQARGSDSPYILDLVITNDSDTDNINYLAPFGNSDHSLLDIRYNSSEITKVYVKKRNSKKGDYKKLRRDLNIDWDSVLRDSPDIETVWSKFKDILHQAIDTNIPAIANFSSWKNRKWKRPLDKRTLALINDKHKF